MAQNIVCVLSRGHAGPHQTQPDMRTLNEYHAARYAIEHPERVT